MNDIAPANRLICLAVPGRFAGYEKVAINYCMLECAGHKPFFDS